MQPISRRHLLRSAAAALGAGALARLGVRPVFAADGEGAVIGRSQGGQALTVYRYGNGPMKLFIMGAQHGGPEANTNELARMLTALTPAMRVLYMSGYTDLGAVPAELFSECTLLRKPFSAHALARKVREVLDAAG